MASNWSSNLPSTINESVNSYIFIIIALLVTGSVLLRRLSITRDHREPPIVGSRIPIIGHLLGLIRHDAEYLSILT